MIGLNHYPVTIARSCAVVLVGVLAACNGDDSGTSTSTATATETTATATETTATATETTATATATETTATATATDTSGTASASGTGTGTTGGDPAECVVDSDCKQVSNCCECSSIPTDETPDACDIDCFVELCTAEGLEELAPSCRSGVCEFASALTCKGTVTCDAIPPECEEGTVPSIVDECWGPCVPFHYCADTSSCASGCGEGWVCVESQSGGAGGCMPLPGECGGEASCECTAPYWSEVCPSVCSGGGGSLLCNDGG